MMNPYPEPLMSFPVSQPAITPIMIHAINPCPWSIVALSWSLGCRHARKGKPEKSDRIRDCTGARADTAAIPAPTCEPGFASITLESISYQSGRVVSYSGFRLPRLWIFACLSILFLVLAARGQQPVEAWKAPHLSIPAKDLYAAATAVASPEGTNIVLLEDDESFAFDDAGRLTHTAYFIYKILTQKGAEGWDAFSVGWQPWHEARPEIRVRVITPDLA